MAKKITISGIIGWDYTAQEIRDSLREASGDDLDIELVTPGGDVFDGIEIYNAIRDYKREFPNAEIMGTLKGLVASMGTYIACCPAFSLLTAEDNAVYMIHNAWSCMCGDYNDMQTTADMLKGLTEIIAKTYSLKTGKPIAEIKKMMDNETWLFGDEIKAAGFVDDMVKSDDGKKDKSQALAAARLQFGAMANSAQKKTDIKAFREKAAAMIQKIPAVKAAVLDTDKNEKGDNDMEIKSLADLKTANAAVYKEAVDEISKEAVAKERERVNALAEFKAKAAKVGDAVSLIDEAIKDGRDVSAIAAQVTDMVLAAADSPAPVNASGIPDEATNENDGTEYQPIGMVPVK